MKTVVTDFMSNGLASGGVVTIKNGVQVTQHPALTADEISKYREGFNAIRAQFYKVVEPMIVKGSFEFDPSLWVWFWKQPDPYNYNLWVRITWVDENDIGKAAFMDQIKRTGLLHYGYTMVKQYS